MDTTAHSTLARFLKHAEHLARGVTWLVLVVAASGCTPQSAATPASTPVPVAARETDGKPPQAHNLTIYGYNYTNTEIGSFEVNGQGGGNVMISDPENGGGSGVCCVTAYSPLRQPKMVKIKWTRDLDTWCEQEVELKPPIPADAKNLEVHFYRDGHIELAVTGNWVTRMSSPPRVRLDAPSRAGRHQDQNQNVNNDAKFARCKLGYR
jgi:hypothetical protein